MIKPKNGKCSTGAWERDWIGQFVLLIGSPSCHYDSTSKIKIYTLNNHQWEIILCYWSHGCFHADYFSWPTWTFLVFYTFLVNAHFVWSNLFIPCLLVSCVLERQSKSTSYNRICNRGNKKKKNMKLSSQEGSVHAKKDRCSY